MRCLTSFVLIMVFVGLSIADEPATVIDEIPIDDFDRDHWSFQPVASPTVPKVASASWPQTSIDYFILARLESKSLRPTGTADRSTLIRRLTYGLHGLPPSTAQIYSYLNDDRPGAYRRLVDRLLASPQYGRHWSQHWLDLARFAETDGFEHDRLRPDAWKFRDWVIDAINDDMPLDAFITRQVAGDVLDAEDPDAAISTAFCLSGPDMPDINSQDERKHVLLNELTSTFGSVFLSLQIGCAECHDHKYDAISQADFYRLRAFFDPAIKLQAKKSVTTLSDGADTQFVSRLFHRGDWRSPGPKLDPAFPRIANRANQEVESAHDGQRRMELARWLTDAANPLTARSIVNRVWQFHFGNGFSRTPSDFGVMGDDPSHPELLDHLTTNFVSQGWSLKALHREIVLSAVYQTQSHPATNRESAGDRASWNKALLEDPDNRLLSRFPRRRLNAEAIRDSMLMISGQLDHQAGGPGVRPPLPQEMLSTLLKGQWDESPREADHYRRSIYLFARRNLRYPMFATFDRPAANCSCAVRQPSTTAVQSLTLLNSRFTLDAATRFAKLLTENSSRRDKQIDELYRRLFSRRPSDAEKSQAIDFLKQQTTTLRGAGAELDALTDLCRAMFNSNLFLYID
tara:strand:+ start:93115 stop:95001 length:1887 start_codon:yes stop_codon:yes gene_type:complete